MSTDAVEVVVDAYGEAWSTRDEAARTACLKRAWADDAVYLDPTVRLVGREALAAHIVDFQNRFEGFRIEIASHIDQHHGMLRFSWQIVARDGTVASVGMDFGELSEDGRLSRIVGFFGPLRPL